MRDGGVVTTRTLLRYNNRGNAAEVVSGLLDAGCSARRERGDGLTGMSALGQGRSRCELSCELTLGSLTLSVTGVMSSYGCMAGEEEELVGER